MSTLFSALRPRSIAGAFAATWRRSVTSSAAVTGGMATTGDKPAPARASGRPQPRDPHPSTLFRPELYKQRLPSLCTAWASPGASSTGIPELAAFCAMQSHELHRWHSHSLHHSTTADGRQMFKEALAAGTADCYLPLSCQFDSRELRTDGALDDRRRCEIVTSRP